MGAGGGYLFGRPSAISVRIIGELNVCVHSICTYAYILICTYIITCFYIYKYVFMYIYICAYIYMYKDVCTETLQLLYWKSYGPYWMNLIEGSWSVLRYVYIYIDR